MGDLLETAARCPHCRAAVRPGAPWCTLCHADLRPQPEPAPEPAPELLPASRAEAAPGLDPLTAPAAALGLPPRTGTASWPCATCSTRNALADSTCAGCGAGFLAGLREAEGPLLELPVVGDLAAMSKGRRTGLALAVVVVVMLLVGLLGLLLG